MQNSFAGNCRTCRRYVAAGEGQMLRVQGKLILFCHQHAGSVATMAMQWARTWQGIPNTAPPIAAMAIEDGRGNGWRFSDGSVTRLLGSGMWVAAKD
jgi:hypothetical protein